MTLDLERTGKLIGAMRSAVGLLRELAAVDEADFLKDLHKQSSAKYNFIAAIESVIDVANHFISRSKLRSPEDYADTFAVLVEAGVLDADFGAELKKMARFRNRLVHLYWNVDAAELHGILQTRLGDFERFLTAVGARLTSI